MDKNRFLELTQLGKEGRNLEFKRSTPWETPEFKAKIAKSVLAFSNVRDGGAIVIGVDQQGDGAFQFAGVSPEHLATYTEDELSSYVSEFAHPYAKLTLERAEVDGKVFLIILIHEFDEIPVICKRDGPSNLRKGAIYTRPYRMPENSEVPTQTELREILDIAVEKGIRKYFERQLRLGI